MNLMSDKNNMKNNNVTRRTLGLGALSMAFLSSLSHAYAISTNQAESFVSQALKDLEKLSQSGASPADLERFLSTYADMPILSRAVLGTPWRGLNGQQRSQYIAAFQKYVSRKYASEIGKLNGGKAQISRSRDSGKAGVLVDVDFVKAGQAPVTVSLQVSDMSGSPKIIDLRFVGVSIIGTERENIRAMLAKNGNNVDQLIQDLSN